jgi:heme/copper-type cytochrome/quinol oxidase subunit 4
MSSGKKGDKHMRDVVETTSHGDGRATFVGFMAIIAVADMAFVFGLTTKLSWQACTLVVVVATALAAGAVFTVVEMQRVAKEGHHTGRVR